MTGMAIQNEPRPRHQPVQVAGVEHVGRLRRSRRLGADAWENRQNEDADRSRRFHERQAIRDRRFEATTNFDLMTRADAIVMIPVNSRFASLNLAQAVLILGYEWMRHSEQATLGRVTTFEQPLRPGLYLGDQLPATREELTGFFDHLERVRFNHQSLRPCFWNEAPP